MYLVFAILFGSLFSIIFKLCQKRLIDGKQVVLFNYITAALVSLVPLAVKLWSGNAPVADYSLHGSSLAFSVLQGLLFVIGFSLMDISVWRSGVALTTVSARASLVLPVIFSALLLGQSAPNWVAVGIVLAALILIVLPAENQKHEGVKLTDKTDEQRRRRTILDLIAVFLCYGVSDFGLKLAQNSVEVHLEDGAAIDSHLDALMCAIFISASILSLAWCFITGSFRKHKVSIGSITGGVALGIVNILCTSSSLRALSTMSTAIYYPLYNIGIVLVATFAGVLFFKEKVKWLQFGGIALSILAIFLFFR